jgi:Yip1 domain
MDDTTSGSGAGSPELDAPALPPFYRRAIDTFVAPGRLAEALRAHPAWALALVVGALLVAAQVGLIPADVWTEMRRQALLRSGQQMPEMSARAQNIIRIVTPVFGAITVVAVEFVFAGIVTLIFAFVMGDEGRYRQYLAMQTHAGLIPGVVGLLLLPLKISQHNPQLSLNLGTFFFFLPDGYVHKVLVMMDLAQIWALLVVAVGVHAIDRKRSVGTAATVLIVLNLALVMVLAIFTPTPG